MLHSYSFSNFRSFRGRVDVPFTLTQQAAVNGWDRVSPSGQRMTTALAVIGPNASGKTTLLQPLAFLAWFIRFSFDSKPDTPIPVTPHFSLRASPTDFEVIVDADEPNTIWRYQLSTTPRHVVSESLEQKKGQGRWYRIFDRHLKGDDRYEVAQKDFGLDPKQAESVRPNVSLISWGAQYGVPFAKRLTDFVVQTNINATGRAWHPSSQSLESHAKYYAENESQQRQMREIMARLDFGLSDVLIREMDLPDPSGETKKHWITWGLHVDSSNGKTHPLPFSEESSGTRTAFMLLATILSVLSTGGVLVYDEIESDLHPMMLEPLLDLFSNPDTNPHNGQIIFTSHALQVLQFLQKSQVMLVEKDGLESAAWRLDSLEGVRSDDNRLAKYLAGTYGAIPRL